MNGGQRGDRVHANRCSLRSNRRSVLGPGRTRVGSWPIATFRGDVQSGRFRSEADIQLTAFIEPD